MRIVSCALYTVHCTLYTPHSTLHTPPSTLHTPHSTLQHAAALPKQHGEGWWEEGDEKRAELFKKIDDNGDGAISFDEWLAFVIEKYKGEKLIISSP